MNSRRQYVLDTFELYWPENQGLIDELCSNHHFSPWLQEPPPELELVNLPDWAYDLGIEGKLAVPAIECSLGSGQAWESIDWISVMFWFLHGMAERAYEEHHGPIHSYSAHLAGWPSDLWNYAWTNRIALFLRRWCARRLHRSEQELFGSLPKPSVIMTHDLDAVRKTFVIRFKQTVFNLFNCCRSILSGKPGQAFDFLAKGLRFFLSKGNYAQLENMCNQERAAGIRSIINVFAGRGKQPLKPANLLIDPSYSPASPNISTFLSKLMQSGWHVGLHQSFETWDASIPMILEKKRLEKALPTSLLHCRQHWLRFSWKKTWQAQSQAGFSYDYTLAFNDRPGFRNSTALPFHPWDDTANAKLSIKAVPTILMDSHLFDYVPLSSNQRFQRMKRLIDEVILVHGKVAVLWHPHTLASDYGWEMGFRDLLSLVKNLDGSIPS